MMDYCDSIDMILGELKRALSSVNGEEAQRLADMILEADQVFVVGVGRVLLMLQAFAKRLNHLGIDANFVGAIDEPAITGRDLLIAGSGSGESLFPLGIVKKAGTYGAKIVHIGSHAGSSMAEYEDLFVRIPCRTKLNLPDEIDSVQPMSSLFEQSLLLFEDAVALMIIEKKGIRDLGGLWRKHANLE